MIIFSSYLSHAFFGYFGGYPYIDERIRRIFRALLRVHEKTYTYQTKLCVILVVGEQILTACTSDIQKSIHQVFTNKCWFSNGSPSRCSGRSLSHIPVKRLSSNSFHSAKNNTHSEHYSPTSVHFIFRALAAALVRTTDCARRARLRVRGLMANISLGARYILMYTAFTFGGALFSRV